VDNHNVGWLFDLAGEGADLMSAEEYRDFLTANWELTQRLLKGQVNME
jgi:hypothetical protein